jgi:conjugal transfer pilus assembly protein TraF
MRTPSFVHALALALPISAIADHSHAPAAYWRDNWRGWHFYEDPADEEPSITRAVRPPILPIRPAPPTAPIQPPELQAFERLQKSLEEHKRIAIMRPTESNVRR